MNHITKFMLFLLSFLMITVSCNKEKTDKLTPEQILSIEQKEQVALMKELSLVVGECMANKKARGHLLELVRVKNDNSEAISLASLLGSESNIPYYEKELLVKGYKNQFKITNFSNNTFKNVFMEKVMLNLKKYPQIANKAGNYKTTGADYINELSEKLSAENLEVYVPYEEEFDWNNISEVSVTWHPLIREDWNEGNLFEITNDGKYKEAIRSGEISIIDDDYAFENPTILIRGIDPDDYQGNSGETNDIPTTKWLTTNIDHTAISEKDVLSTFIPKLKLTGHYRGFLGGSSQINIYRASGNLEFDESGALKPDGDKFKLLENEKITRRDIRKKNWVTVNVYFDDDWDLHENGQQFVLTSRQGIFSGSKLEISGKINVGYDFEKKKATASATCSQNFKITTDRRNILRYNNQISRRGVLSNVVGDNGAGTYNDNGTLYSIRTADKLHYYFKHKWTDIDE